MKIKDIINKIDLTQKNRIKSERADLLKFFLDNLRDKNNKPFRTGHIATKLSHIKTADLYYVKSCFRERLMRDGIDTASKWLWWSLRPQK